MFKLWVSIKKDWHILIRDRLGLAIMFIMPVILAIVIASVQNSTFELVNNKKVPLLLLSQDTGAAARVLVASLEKGGMFNLKKISSTTTVDVLKEGVRKKDALLGIVIPQGYSAEIMTKAENISGQALSAISVTQDTAQHIEKEKATSLTLYYNPILQKSYRQGVDEALNSVLQIVQSKYIIKQLYSSINNDAQIPEGLEQQILSNQTPVKQLPVSRGNSVNVPNATQHNIPAWTVFAMFFVVVSLGSNIVREKTSGSFMRLRTMPTSLSVSIISKQITYVIITILQAIVIFAIGKWIFPKIGLPPLNLPADITGLILIILLCGLCATSFAICVGIYAKTPEQSNGTGAIIIVLLAALGGLLVPAFAMPDSFRFVMKLSPLYWCLEAFYSLFLEGGKLKDILLNIIPLIAIIIFFQMIAWAGMKQQKLI